MSMDLRPLSMHAMCMDTGGPLFVAVLMSPVPRACGLLFHQLPIYALDHVHSLRRRRAGCYAR